MNQHVFTGNNNLSIIRVFKLFIKNIWFILPCIVLALIIAYAYNWYAIPVYRVTSSILLKDGTGSNRYSGESSFLNSELLYRNQNIQNELEIIKSRPNIENTVRNLELEISYYEYKKFQYYNIYNESPFNVVMYEDHPQLVGTLFEIVFHPDGSFTLDVEKQDGMVYLYNTGMHINDKEDLDFNLNGNVGQVIESEDFKFLVTINDKNSLVSMENRIFAFQFSTITQLVNQIENSLEFTIPDQLATIIEISMETNSVQLGEDVINQLIEVYSESTLEKKNHLANITLDYIQQQLDEVSASLNTTETNLQRFMSQNRLMNVDEQSTRLGQQRLELQNQLAELMTLKRYYEYIEEYNEDISGDAQIIPPSSMGVQDLLLNNLVEELSAAQAQKNNLVKNNQQRNPLVGRLDIQIKNLKNTIMENISAAARSNEISINEMQNRIAQIDSELSRLPRTQMQMGGIQRNYNLNNSIYNYLLEKQAEAKITKASNLPDNIIIEPAHMVGLYPVSPNKMLNYLIALFLGFIIPFSVVLIKYGFKSTITSQEDIENITNATIVGKVFHSNIRKEKNVFLAAPNAKTTETFRTLRTNLNFALNGRPNKIILVTSCLSGEGKTFNALNIASSYAQMGKKTILLNFDLRMPDSVIANTDNSKGVSTYLSEESQMNEIIQNTELNNLDYINSGPIPPNPLDLLEKDIIETFFEFVKENYEYIIIDTPPLGQVSDALAIIKYANIVLVVTRYNMTKKKILKVVLSELRNKNINNVYIILNDNKVVEEQLGYGYYKKKGKSII